MSKLEKFASGDSINIAVPAYAVVGSPVQVLGIVGVCETARDAAGNATVRRNGVFTLTVTGVTAIGTPVFITTATGAPRGRSWRRRQPVRARAHRQGRRRRPGRRADRSLCRVDRHARLRL
jgi:hypothetical protein